MKKAYIVFILGLLFFGSYKSDVNNAPASMETGKDYPAYDGNNANNCYSPLAQINIDNVKDLELGADSFQFAPGLNFVIPNYCFMLS